jgi:ferritin-like metal-binding protein YciE
MRIFNERMQDLHALYVRQLRLLLSAEEMIAIKTPFFTERARDPELRVVFRKITEDSEARTEQLRELLGRTESAPLKCKTIFALFDEAEELVQIAAHEEVRDAVLITEAQRIKHYEIAAYRAVRQFAQVLDRPEDERILNETFLEKVSIDEQLSTIAERANRAAKAA